MEYLWVKVVVVNAKEVDEALWGRWSELQKRDATLASPYFCSQYTRAVGKVRRDVYVGVMEYGGRTWGFFPFQRNRLGVGRPVGGALSDFHGIIALLDAPINIGELARRCSLSTWRFDHLLASQKPFQPFVRAIRQSPFMDLSSGYEAYARERREAGSEQIKKTANLRRRIEREIGPLRFVRHESDLRAFRKLMQWKTAQCLRSGTTDVFSYPWVVALLEHLLQIQEHGFAGMLSCLYVNDRLIAAHFGMRSVTVWHYWFPCYDEEFARYSPGLILLLAMAEEAPRMGLTTIDLGKGDALYKQRLASGSTAIGEGSLEIGAWASTLRRIRAGFETLAANPRLPRAAQFPARVLRRVDRWQRFR